MIDTLMLRDEAQKQLAQIKTVESGVEYLNKVKAIETWAKAEKKDAILQNAIAEQKIRTQKILGGLLKEELPQGRSVTNSDTLSLNKIGISRNQSSTFQKIASMPEELFEKEIAQAKDETNKRIELTTSRLLKAAKQYELNEKRKDIENNIVEVDIKNVPELFDIIYADPPWQYDFSETNNRKIENHYTTMNNEDIMNMKVPCKDNSVLFMWATAPKLPEALQVMKAWGFEYKTNAIWDKETIGMGYWFRGQHELLLVGVKGKFSPPISSIRISSIIKEKKTKHSKKPYIVADYIEQAYPDKTKIELFCREPRKGWYVFGNQI